MSSKADRALLASIAADITLILGYIVSRVRPEYRIWPIGDSTWRWWFNWSALSVVFTGFPVLAWRDWNSCSATDTPLRIVGAIISTVGMAFSLSALFELGWLESSGREGELRTDGIYEHTRNPQSVGFITFIVGTLLTANSRKLAIHGILTVVIYILFPFAEEPWLREQYGEEYKQYCTQTPRFIGWGTVTTLLNK